MRDVAEAAGVSVATVSRVLNDSGPVSDATRARIEKVARTLRYRPNGAARSLITRKTETLGVLLPDLHGEFFSEVIRGIDQAARGAAYHLLVSGSHSDRNEMEAVLQAMHGRVDGLIMMSPDIDARGLEENLPRGLPVVLLCCRVEGAPHPSLNVENYEGARAMVAHLLEHGHRRVALIKGGEDNYDAQERLHGYRAAMKAAGIEWSEALEVAGDFRQASGYRAARRLLAQRPRPTAIFAANDAMALGALSALREAGLRVPEDVALAGFDDIPLAGYLTPSLTSVHVPISELGARAVTMLLHAVEEEDYRIEHATLPAAPVFRRSCGCDGEAVSDQLSAVSTKASSAES